MSKSMVMVFSVMCVLWVCSAAWGQLEEGVLLEADGKVIDIEVGHLVPVAVDWNEDGRKDLLVGHDDTIIFYKNIGSKTEYKFAAPKLIEIPEGKFPSRPSPFVVDWDGDGKKDLLSGGERPVVTFYRNIGAAQEPKLAEGVDLKLTGPEFDKGYRCRIDVTDWNNDGKPDILVGNFFSYKKPMGGNIWLFLRK